MTDKCFYCDKPATNKSGMPSTRQTAKPTIEGYMDIAEVVKQLRVPCGKVIGHGDVCASGWECLACQQRKQLADTFESLIPWLATVEKATNEKKS